MKLPLEAINTVGQTEDTSEVTNAYIDTKNPLPGYGVFSESIEYLKDDQKAKNKYIKYLERLTRGSYELRSYLSLLRENVEMTKCTLLNGVSSEDARIELHHFPFTMYDIARIILDDALEKQDDVTSFQLVGRIVAEHYMGNVGLVPLSVTAHELVHDGKLTVSLKSVSGNWREFAKKYSHVLTKGDIENLKFLINASATPELQHTNVRKLRVLKRNILPMEERPDKKDYKKEES